MAVKHYEYLKRGLQDAGIDPSAFNIALAWNCGLGAVVGGRVPGVTYRYAEQVNNLVETFRERQSLAVFAKSAAASSELTLRPAATPHFTIGNGGLRFVVASDAPRYVLAD